MVQVTSSPVSLGQEFSSQSPQVPQEARGPQLQGVEDGQQPNAVLTDAGDPPSVLLRRGQRGVVLLSKISGSRWASENMFGNFILWKTLCEASAVSVCF